MHLCDLWTKHLRPLFICVHSAMVEQVMCHLRTNRRRPVFNLRNLRLPISEAGIPVTSDTYPTAGRLALSFAHSTAVGMS